MSNCDSELEDLMWGGKNETQINISFKPVEETRKDICYCTKEGTIMELSAKDAMFICPKCSSTVKTDVYQAEDQSFNKIKYDNKALRVFNTYWLPIIGKEDWNTNKMEPGDLAKLDEYLNLKNFRSKNARSMLTCSELRQFIKDLRLPNALNTHVTKLLIYFGVTPPYEPTTRESDIIFKWYLEAINTYESIKLNLNQIIPGLEERSNNIARTYYIYKIIEAVWPNDDKMKTVLKFIHLQHTDTIYSNDLIWEKICEKINLKYIPTLRY